MRRDNRRTWTLIGVLAVVMVIVILVALKLAGGSATTADKDERSMDAVKSATCQQQLRQTRAGIDAYRQSRADKGNPPTLKDALSGISGTYFQCPVTSQAYSYDPNTGTVACPSHPGF